MVFNYSSNFHENEAKLQMLNESKDKDKWKFLCTFYKLVSIKKILSIQQGNSYMQEIMRLGFVSGLVKQETSGWKCEVCLIG